MISGDRELRFRQVKEIMGFASDAETAQYLINRGIESCTPIIRNWLMIKDVSDRTVLQQAEFFERIADQVQKDGE